MAPDQTVHVECWQCGGEGRVAGTCIDGCCIDQDDPDCEYCSHRCDICQGKGGYEVPLDSDAARDAIGV